MLPLARHHDGPSLLSPQHQWSIVVAGLGTDGGWKRGERYPPRHTSYLTGQSVVIDGDAPPESDMAAELRTPVELDTRIILDLVNDEAAGDAG